jgi:hypothetical protein
MDCMAFLSILASSIIPSVALFILCTERTDFFIGTSLFGIYLSISRNTLPNEVSSYGPHVQ